MLLISSFSRQLNVKMGLCMNEVDDSTKCCTSYSTMSETKRLWKKLASVLTLDYSILRFSKSFSAMGRLQ